MRVPCPNDCGHQISAKDAATGLAYLAISHWCEIGVDPDNDPRNPRDDAHREEMEQARQARAQALAPTTVDERPDLAQAGHTITVERLDKATAREVGRTDAAGQLAVIERTDGRIGKVCSIEGEAFDGVTIEAAARSVAWTYGARLVQPTLPVPSALCREAGLPPLQITVEAWADTVAWTLQDQDRTGAYQEMEGRLWDVVYMARIAMKKLIVRGRRATFPLCRVSRVGGREPEEIRLELRREPGQDGHEVYTIAVP